LYSLTKISGQFQNSGQFQDNFEISGLLGPLRIVNRVDRVVTEITLLNAVVKLKFCY